MNTKQTTEPKTLQEAIRYFSDDETCLHFMMPIVWLDGVQCSHCGAKDAHFIATRRIWRCKGCKKQFSIKTGTVMEDSPIGLDKWLVAMWLIANAKNGISSYEIHRDLGITQKSAWFLLHRIRLAMKSGTFKKMTGPVEADEMYIGGATKNFRKSKIMELKKEAKAKRPGKPVRLNRMVKKSIVLGLLERAKDGKPSQMRTQMLESTKRPHLGAAVKANVNPGSFLMTDALNTYKALGAEGYIHMAVNHAIKYAEGRIHTNGVENFWSLLARTLQGTYVACEPFHLEAYLDEQCYRFNNRKATDSERFLRLLGMIGGKRITLAELTGKNEPTVLGQC